MKYMKFALAGLVAAALLTTTTLGATNAPVATAAPDLGKWTLSLSGNSVTTTTSPSTTASGVELSLGHTGRLILPLEFGVRQSVGYATGAQWALGTTVYNEWRLIKLGNLEFDGGANVGVLYGNQTLAWSAGPEATARLWLTKNVNTFLRGEYPFTVTGNNTPTSQNRVAGAVGLQVRF